MAAPRPYGSATVAHGTALSTLAGTPLALSTSASANELIKVPSMPMWSAVERPMPAPASDAPRTKFPAPSTSASSAPSECAEAISPASQASRACATPQASESASISPDSLNRIRRGFSMLGAAP